MGACVMESAASFIKHEPCPNCGSKDNLARYADGGGHCFGCEYHEFPEGETSSPTLVETKGGGSVLTDLEYKPLPKRGITVDTCKKFGYMIGKYKDQPVQVCQFRNNTGEVEAQKLRYPNKDFRWINKSDALFGQHLWEKGKWVVVTEGEIDALTVSQLFNNRWATVSITTGATGAKKQLAKNLEWLEKFDHVVLMFDEDEAGRKAISECVELFSPGKVKIASLPMKDANECLLNNLGQAVVSAVWDAKVYRPDGIINAKDTWDIFIRDDKVEAKEYPWKSVNDFLSGLRKKELVTITAGSGIGKSLFCRELAYWKKILNERFKASPLYISTLLYTWDVETLLKRNFGKLGMFLLDLTGYTCTIILDLLIQVVCSLAYATLLVLAIVLIFFLTIYQSLSAVLKRLTKEKP